MLLLGLPLSRLQCFFFNDTASTEIYTLSLHDALPICWASVSTPSAVTDSLSAWASTITASTMASSLWSMPNPDMKVLSILRSEEHTSELQSRQYLVCRLLLDKKKLKYSQIRRAQVCIL